MYYLFLLKSFPKAVVKQQQPTLHTDTQLQQLTAEDCPTASIVCSLVSSCCLVECRWLGDWWRGYRSVYLLPGNGQSLSAARYSIQWRLCVASWRPSQLSQAKLQTSVVDKRNVTTACKFSYFHFQQLLNVPFLFSCNYVLSSSGYIVCNCRTRLNKELESVSKERQQPRLKNYTGIYLDEKCKLVEIWTSTLNNSINTSGPVYINTFLPV